MADEIENMYETALMKPYLKKDDVNYSATGIPPNSRVLVCGMTGSGKSNVVYNYLKKSPGIFHRVIVFCRTDDEPVYRMFKEKLAGHIEFHHSMSELPPLNKLREKFEDTDRVLLIIDDFQDQLNKPTELVNDYFNRGRKQNICIWVLAQDFFTIKKKIRNQMTFICLHRMESRNDRSLIKSETCLGRNDIWDAYTEATSKKFHFFKINQTTTDLTQKFTHNFTGKLEFKEST